MRDILSGIIYIKVTTIDKREILEVENNRIKLEIEKFQEYKEKYDVNYEVVKKVLLYARTGALIELKKELEVKRVDLTTFEYCLQDSLENIEKSEKKLKVL